MRILKLSLFIICIVLLISSFVHSTSDVTGIPLESNPHSIAIDPIANIAVITNEKADSVSVVDLDTGTLLHTIPVGKAPRGVAIDNGLNIAIIGNSHDDTVSIIDINDHSLIGTLPVGKQPEGIALNPLTHMAIIADHQEGTVSIIDLSNYRIIGNIQVGQEPIDVAIDPGLNLALVVNEKDYTVTIIDLNTYQVTGTVPVGKKPQTIAINPETHIAGVVNEKDNSITVINLLTWQKNTIYIGKHPRDIDINPLDNRALVISDEDRSLRLIDLNTNTIIKTYSLNKLPTGVAVNNFTNIAAVADDKTDSLTLIQLPNPAPQISSINPDAIIRGSKSTDIIIEGSRFTKGSVVSVQGITSQILQAGFMDNHSLRATIPEELLQKSGAYQVTVANPSPSGGKSNSAILSINNPVPSIFMVEPAEAMAGTQGLTLTLYGTGIFDDTEVYFGDIKKQISYINNTKLQIYLTPEDLKTPGQYEITARNSSPGGGNSNKLIFTIKNPLEIKITSPADGETINKAKVIVKGTIKSDSGDIGVKVNGTIADITGTEWITNNVPLTVGSNIITATVTDSLGNTDTKTITINTNDTSQPVQLSANISSGIAPMQVCFSASTSTFTPASYQMDFEGDGVIDYTGTTFEDIRYTYTAEGVSYPTITVIDSLGNVYADRLAITVLNMTSTDTLLKEKWNGMNAKLINQDAEGALAFIVSNSHEMYRYNFDLMRDILPAIIQSMSEINLDELRDGLAKYSMNAIQDGVEYSFYVEFVKDIDGLWKIRFF